MSSTDDSGFLILYIDEVDKNLTLSNGIAEIFFDEKCPDFIKNKLHELLSKVCNNSILNESKINQGGS